MEQQLRAIETRSATKSAIKAWVEKFCAGSTTFRYRGGEAFGHTTLGVWGYFNDPYGTAAVGGYWNVFGRFPSKEILVEVNPPQSGINTNVQGLIACDKNDERWILHQGRLHPSQIRITEDMFDSVVEKERVEVRFSDGRARKYHRVANIDAPPATLQAQMVDFIVTCEMVRQFYLHGSDAAKKLPEIIAIEGLFPEVPGNYEIGPQNAKTVQKKHPDVWRGLFRELEKKGVACSNGRVAQWGPDLKTLTKNPVLFEIKSGESASEIQRAVGQLLLYEKLLKKRHLKVLVYPQSEKSTDKLKSALAKLDIHVLPYVQNETTPRFEPFLLAKYIKHAMS